MLLDFYKKRGAFVKKNRPPNTRHPVIDRTKAAALSKAAAL
jgi:hypothetical protein